MDFGTSFLQAMRRSKLRIGSIRAQGPPAVILATSAVVLAAGLSRTLRESGPALPETFREFRKLLAANNDRKAIEQK